MTLNRKKLLVSRDSGKKELHSAAYDNTYFYRLYGELLLSTSNFVPKRKIWYSLQ